MRTIFLLALAACAAPAPGQEAKEWTPLFNGKDLAGWEPVGPGGANWKVEEGRLVCGGGKSGWLSTKETYGDFEIELEWKIAPGGNSGVFIRSPREGNPWEVGMEIQLLDDDAPIHKNIKEWQRTASIYGVVPPSKPMQKKAGEWNTITVRCKGPQVVITLNGEKVVDADLDLYEKLKDRPRKGYIGLQNHGTVAEFRNLRLRRLD